MKVLKDVRRAAARGELTSTGAVVAEGPHLLEEAVRSGCTVQVVLVAESKKASVTTTAPVIVLPDKMLAATSSTESTQGVIALVEPPRWTVDDLFRGTPMVVILDGIQDPGNAGTIVRTAEAFGATGVVFLKGTVSPYNPKTLRASAGSLFRLPFVTGALPALDGVHIWAAESHSG